MTIKIVITDRTEQASYSSLAKSMLDQYGTGQLWHAAVEDGHGKTMHLASEGSRELLMAKLARKLSAHYTMLATEVDQTLQAIVELEKMMEG